MAVTNAAVRGILNELAFVNTPQQIIFVTGGSTRERRQPYVDAGAQMKLVYADRATCQQRAAVERPAQWSDYVNKWHDAYNADQGRHFS